MAGGPDQACSCPASIMILEEMNQPPLLTSCGKSYPGQWERIGHMAILAYGQVHMANLAVAWSPFASTACPQLHTEILKKSHLPGLYVMLSPRSSSTSPTASPIAAG